MEFLSLLIVGLAVGFVSGMFGIGGAVIMTPILILMGYPDNIALATPLTGAVFSSVAGSVRYAKSKLINYRTGLIIVASALATSWIGVRMSSLSTEVMIIIKVAFMLFLAINMLFPEKALADSSIRPKLWILLAIGGFAGVFSAMIAIGGGLIFIFAFSNILKFDIKRTVATSLFCVGAISLVNSILHFKNGNVNLNIALPIILGIIATAPFGSTLSLKLKSKTLKTAFGIVLTIFAVGFLTFRLFFCKS
jgi:uncharacterized membrane protein YfcA